MRNKNHGRLAEFLATIYFRLKFYKIIKKNYKGIKKTPVGEVDFIALKNKTLVFVEVKKRQTIEKAKYSIKTPQQKRIISAAKLFIKQNPCYRNCKIRFDAVLIKFPFTVVHIKDAWDE